MTGAQQINRMIHQVEQRENRTIKTILLCEVVKDKTTRMRSKQKRFGKNVSYVS